MSMIFLQDDPESEAIASMVVDAVSRWSAGSEPSLVPHASGRPWIVGNLRGIRLVESADRSSILFAESSCLDDDRQAQILHEDLTRRCDKTRMLSKLAGDGIVGISVDGSQLIAGTITGGRRLYAVETRQGTVVSDSASLLASVFRLTVSLERLAIRLCTSLPYFPFSALPLWASITPIAPHCAVEVPPRGPVRQIRWWHAPIAALETEEAAESLAASLTGAITTATRRAASVTADLSGGLDSTSIVYALCAEGIRPSAFHARSVSHRNSDHEWARKAADDLGIELRELPSFGSGARAFLLEDDDARSFFSDYPAKWMGSYGYLDALGAALAPLIKDVHFTGIGGDELFGPLPAVVWSVMREHGVHGITSVTRLASSARAPLARVFRSAMSRLSFEDALASLPERLVASPTRLASLSGDWFARPHVGKVLSSEGRVLLLAGIEAIASRPPAPLDQDRGRHQMLESLQFQGQVLAQINQTFGTSARWHSPYLARAVVESASSVRTSSRVQPGAVKPLLAMATAQLSMPREFFARPVTGEYSADMYAEFASRRPRLLDKIGESRIAAAGLIDVDYLTDHISEPSPSPEFLSELEAFVSLERWLRRADVLGIGL